MKHTLFYRGGELKFFEPEEFPRIADIELEWKTVRKELGTLLLRWEEIPNFHEYSPIQICEFRERFFHAGI